jgi:predicted NUDIX family NTP pyrophosphohydrolase
MPVIIFALNQGRVLLGSGGRWYKDGKSTEERKKIREMQSTTAVTQDDAVADLISTAPPGMRVSPLVKEGNVYYTKFIDPSKGGNPWGFIKGTFPDDNHSGESPEAAARREFYEETSTELTEPLTLLSMPKSLDDPYIYKVDLDDEKAKAVIENWRQKTREMFGELVNLEWVPIENVTTNLNPESNAALPLLPGWRQGGGSRRVFSHGMNKMVKTRSMTARAKTARKHKSHCVGIKRSAVCKRTDGCKYASGTKRRFCRTAKNRKLH